MFHFQTEREMDLPVRGEGEVGLAGVRGEVGHAADDASFVSLMASCSGGRADDRIDLVLPWLPRDESSQCRPPSRSCRRLADTAVWRSGAAPCYEGAWPAPEER